MKEYSSKIYYTKTKEVNQNNKNQRWFDKYLQNKIEIDKYFNEIEITKDNAETLLKDDIQDAEDIINEILNDWEEKGIKPPITQGMYDAMTSMTYNMGRGIRTTDFIQAVKRGDLKLAKKLILTTSQNLFDEFPGLEPRRQKESEMFI